MVDASNLNDQLLRDAASTSAAAATRPQTSLAKTNAQTLKDQFLTMLVAQLKNQDPLDPQKQDQMTAQLAQFSSLEQLVDINEKLGAKNDSLNSLASYLGHEVTLGSDVVSVQNNSAGQVKFTLPGDAYSVKLELVGSDGSVVESHDLGAMNKGEQRVRLDNLSSASGDYQVRVVARSTVAGSFSPKVNVMGVVDGFVPGPEPKLLVGGREVDPASVIQVRAVAGA